MSKLIFEFDGDKDREVFLSCMIRQGEQVMQDDADINGLTWRFEYKNAFKNRGWNGQGDPMVRVITQYRNIEQRRKNERI